jgi:hypothetical protein
MASSITVGLRGKVGLLRLPGSFKLSAVGRREETNRLAGSASVIIAPVFEIALGSKRTLLIEPQKCAAHMGLILGEIVSEIWLQWKLNTSALEITMKFMQY